MSVASLTFIAFVIAFAVLHALWSNRWWRSGLFLAANALFILSFTRSPLALLPFAAFLAWGYVSVRLSRIAGKWMSVVFIAGTLLIFVYLKKYWFLSFLPPAPFPYLTVGLSYAFFRVMGMIVDARDDPVIGGCGPIDYFNFAVNFPTMAAGPIDRYQEFSRPPEPLTPTMVGRGFERGALGFFKIFVLSALVLQPQTQATASILTSSGAERGLYAAVSFGLYPIYLYFNFSGYTDIVIGVGYLFGKRYPENFDQPFSSRSFIELWSRWHMSLSFWLRDYVYTPLLKALMARSSSKTWDLYFGAAAYFVTFFLIGVWHGSTIIFAVFGVLLGVGVSVNKIYQVNMTSILGRREYRNLAERRDYQYLSRGLTYTWFCLCMICFWATTAQATRLMQALGAPALILSAIVILVAAAVVLAVWAEMSALWAKMFKINDDSTLLPYLRAMIVGVLIFGCVAIEVLNSHVNSNIIYQAF